MMPFAPMPLIQPHGQVVMTAGVADWIREGHEEGTGERRASFVTICLGRHIIGDDGDTDPEDKAANARAWQEGDRVLSVYKLPLGMVAPRDTKVYVVTEWDRSVTTILFPSEY